MKIANIASKRAIIMFISIDTNRKRKYTCLSRCGAGKPKSFAGKEFLACPPLGGRSARINKQELRSF
jgi:hypothetical protein